MKKYENHDWCFMARVVFEALTPVKTGSGKGNIKTDAVINRDVNGLPFIPATTLQGLMRHALEQKFKDTADPGIADRIMGWQTRQNGCGSWLSISEAKLVIDEAGHTIDGLLDRKAVDDTPSLKQYLEGFCEMPIRQHVRITQKGTAAAQGKFDEEIIPQGTRFCFEMELRADDKNGRSDFNQLLDVLQSDTFRIGGGSRKGFGKIEIKSIGYKALNLNQPDDLQAYMDKNSSLATSWKGYEERAVTDITNNEAIHYRLELSPTDFILFSSGFGDDRSDMTVVKEPMVTGWSEGTPHWTESEETIAIPASSVKGAIAHRTAFYYNLLTGITANKDNVPTADKADSPATGKRNEAVRSLFGSEGQSADGSTTGKRRGHVLFSDVIRLKKSAVAKVLNHVKIDRFTSGTVKGALFAEEPLYAKNESIKLYITLLPDAATNQEHVTEAFELALTDICKGLLPLGGGVNRGNGCFEGKLYKNDKEI